MISWVISAWRAEFARSQEELEPVPGAAEAVAAVRELGLQVCVASGSLRAAIGTKLARTGLGQSAQLLGGPQRGRAGSP